MFSKSAIAACVALAASAAAQTAPFSNSTLVAPTFISLFGKTWQYNGCGASSNNFAAFVKVETSPSMSIERCLLSASNYLYAGINGNVCYATNVTPDSTTSILPDSRCSYPCPGNPLEPCGGSGGGASPTGIKRQAALAGSLFTLYGTVSIVPIGITYINIFTFIYINVGPLGFQTNTVTTTTTLIGCGCTNPATPTVPVTTTTVKCNACATPGVVTVTIPYGSPAYCTDTPDVPATPIKTVTVQACPTTPAAVPCVGCAVPAVTPSVVPCLQCPGGTTTVTPSAPAVTTKTGITVYTGAASPLTVGNSAVGFFGMVAAIFML